MSTESLDVAARAGALGDELLRALREYVLDRQIRDRPLAMYQSVAHTLADHWVSVQAMKAAVRSPSLDEAASTALALGATRGLLALADDAVRLRGGNGYLVGDIAARTRLAALQLSQALGAPDSIAARLGADERWMFSPPQRVDDEVAAVLDGVWDEGKALAADVEGTLHDSNVHHALADRGWLGAFVAHARLNPELDPLAAFSIAEALTLRGIPIYALNTSAMAAAMIRDHGSAHLRDRILPTLLDGSAICALGYTEPTAGSDLAAIETSASRGANGQWVLRGVKRFCTLVDEAQHVLVLARTDADARRHRGLTLFAVPTNASGLDVRPLPTHGGEVTAELHLGGAFAGDEHVIGEVGGGWAVVMDAMRYERNASPWCDLVRLHARAMELGALPTAHGRTLGGADAWCRALGWLRVDIVLGRALVNELLSESSPIAGVAPSAAKLFCTEALVRSTRRFVTALPAELQQEAPARRIEGMWRRSISLTIAGGASEVQRDVIAMQGLGLPRSA